jgi:hypothetical protein
VLLRDADRGEGCVRSILWQAFSAFSFYCFAFSSWHYVRDQLQIGLNLVHFQRSTRDPHYILSCLTVLLRGGRERENCVRREKERDLPLPLGEFRPHNSHWYSSGNFPSSSRSSLVLKIWPINLSAMTQASAAMMLSSFFPVRVVLTVQCLLEKLAFSRTPPPTTARRDSSHDSNPCWSGRGSWALD